MSPVVILKPLNNGPLKTHFDRLDTDSAGRSIILKRRGVVFVDPHGLPVTERFVPNENRYKTTFLDMPAASINHALFGSPHVADIGDRVLATYEILAQQNLLTLESVKFSIRQPKPGFPGMDRLLLCLTEALDRIQIDTRNELSADSAMKSGRQRHENLIKCALHIIDATLKSYNHSIRETIRKHGGKLTPDKAKNLMVTIATLRRVLLKCDLITRHTPDYPEYGSSDEIQPPNSILENLEKKVQAALIRE